MDFTLSQKESMILQDGKQQEDICVKKYQSFANQAKDPELKQLFNKIASEEQHHLDMINELLQGKVPSQNKKQGAHSSQPANSTEKINSEVIR